jgi:hypothetical protein
MWQNHWKRVMQLSDIGHYVLPKGKAGRWFIATLAREFAGVRQRQWNFERPMLFASVILIKTPGVRRSSDIRKRIHHRLSLWTSGKFRALIGDTEDEVLSRAGSRAQQRMSEDEAASRRFNAQVLSGHLRKAVRGLTNRDGGGVLQPDDACTKTGRPVIEVLLEKHPRMRDPDLTLPPEDTAFESYAHEPPDTVPLLITAEDVEKVAPKLSGSAGPSGVDAVALQHWLLRFGSESEHLRHEIAIIATRLSNESPSWAEYRALMACRLVALDKCPGVRPVGIGEIFRRLIAKCVIRQTGHRAMEECGSFNLCAGLPAGVEGAVHALSDEWDATEDSFVESEAQDLASLILAGGDDPPVEGATAGDTPMTDSTPPDPPGQVDEPDVALLIDARNGFNELGRKAMLWTVRHLWASGARFAFNCYRHASLLILRSPGNKTCHLLASREGITQGDPLAMLLYGVTLVPLARRLREEVPSVVQPWYADDAAMAGPCSHVATAMRLLEKLGPQRGYYPEPAKSIVICRDATHTEAAKQWLEEFNFQYCEGHRYVGGFLGSEAAKTKWLDAKIQDWVYGVERLAMAARKYPQAAYAGLCKSLQSEWQYLQRVLPESGPAFEPVEASLRETFLPALLGAPEGIPDYLRDVLALPIRQAGIGIPNPVQLAAASYATSVECAAPLTKSLREGSDFDVGDYLREARAAREALKDARTMAGTAELTRLLEDTPVKLQRQVRRGKLTGTWLATTPTTFNGTDLSADEFRDSLRLRYGLQPLMLPAKCDGCTQPFSVEHAMSCKAGGLVTLRHNDVAAEWHQLCAQALTPSAVSDEPLIHSSRDNQISANRNGPEVAIQPETRGDVAAHGFWRRGTTAIFDVRITDTDAPSYRNRDPTKILQGHEKEKKAKYLEACLARRRTFTPLVFSVDGMRGQEASAASKRLACLLSSKWNRTYSEVCHFVRSRLSIALVRSTSMCLRGARDPTARASRPAWESGSGLALYH